MKPWGVIHDGCCGFKRCKRESVEILEWESSTDTEDIDRRVEALEKFRDFLRGNVVDASLPKYGSRRSRRGRKGRYNKFNNNRNNSINSDSNDTIDSNVEITIYEK